MVRNYAKALAESERKVRVIYISSYIPRECGIATFTKDLTSSINVLNPRCLAEIIAVNPPGIRYDYPWEVKFRFDQEDWSTYEAAAQYINQSSAEIVCLEHEYGLYGGIGGEMIVKFARMINKPLVTTFHTVLSTPYEKWKHREIIHELAKESEAVAVMVHAAADRLVNIYGVDQNKIVVIPHGVPDMPFLSEPEGKGRLRLKDDMVLSTFGLISKWKGIEYVLQALPEIAKKVPNITYLVLGETHPVVRRKEGELYRRKLQSLVRKLGIQDHVRFENRYLSLDEIVMYLQATDLYVTPYLNMEQITSGTLAYAVGAGLACISTPYIYAQELLDGNRGLLVDAENPKAIAQAVIKLATEPRLRESIRSEAYLYGRQMTWHNVALQHLDLFSSIIEAKKSHPEKDDVSQLAVA